MLQTKWYHIGTILFLAAAVAFQLIWLPAPLASGPGIQWIEWIDIIYYSVITIPLCFVIGAFVRNRQSNAAGKVWLMRIFIVGLGLASILLMCFPLQYLEWLIVILALQFLFVLIDWVAIGKRSKAAGRNLKKGLLIAGAYIVTCFILLCPIGYNTTYPFMTFDLNRYATVVMEQDTIAENKKQAENYSKNSLIDGVLVAERQAFIIDLLYAKVFPHIDLVKRSKHEPSIRETYMQVVTMEQDANQVAAAIAREIYTGEQTITEEGVLVSAVMLDAPALGFLQAGDIIIGLNQQPINNVQQLSSYMTEQVKAGELVHVKVLRGEEELSLSVPTAASEDEERRPVMGIYIEQKYNIQASLNVQYESYLAHFGGPSHGAMLTLAFIDQLSEQALAGDTYVAGTGTIEPNGAVGMVGGIKQKAYAVSRTDADVFFVPMAGVEEAKHGAPELNIVGVNSIYEILEWLEKNSNREEQHKT